MKNATYKVTAIAKGAFKNNKKLKKVTIGKNIAVIGKQAFYNCRKLKLIVVKTKKLNKKSVGSRAFKNIYVKAVAKVPKSKVAFYKKILRARGMSRKGKVKKM